MLELVVDCDGAFAKKPTQFDEYRDARLAEGVEPATINHDLRVLRRMMRLAERKRLISRNPFLEVDFLKQRPVRTPHIVTFEEEEKILAVAPAFIRALVVLILETGMRSHREALVLTWEAIDFESDSIRVRESKTRAGIRDIPLSARCKAELLRWRDMFGPEFSSFVFLTCAHRPSHYGMFAIVGKRRSKMQRSRDSSCITCAIPILVA